VFDYLTHILRKDKLLLTWEKRIMELSIANLSILIRILQRLQDYFRQLNLCWEPNCFEKRNRYRTNISFRVFLKNVTANYDVREKGSSARRLEGITWPNFLLRTWLLLTFSYYYYYSIIVSFMQGSHTHILETNHVPRGYIVAAILSLLFMVPLCLVPALVLLFF